MNKLNLTSLLLLIIFIGACFSVMHRVKAEMAETPSVGLMGLGMKEGDNAAWRMPDFDSKTWPMSRNNGAGFNHVSIPDQIGWLRTPAFGLPEQFKQQAMALHVVTGATFEAYWNGRFLGRNGLPGINLASETNGVSDSRFYVTPDLILAQGNVLAIRYSAHGYSRLPLPLAFSLRIAADENEKYQRLVNHVPAFLLIGGIGAAAIFFAALFIRRRADKGSLWLTLMFLMVVLQLTSEASRALISLTYIGQLLRIGITFAAAYGSGLFLNLYLLNYLNLPRVSKTALLMVHLCLLVVAASYYSQFDKLTYAVLAMFVGAAILIILYCIRLKRPHAGAMLGALVIFAGCFLVGYTVFLDSYYYGAMAILAATLFIVQASIFRQTEQKFNDTKLRINRLELDLLKRQIQPHFIMNTLTALSEWILTSPDQSVDMIEVLSDEFRLLNNFVGKKLVPLDDELDLCHAHLQLMSYRQDQSFVLETDIESKDIAVPPAIFHTLIENALTHNRYSREDSVFHLSQRTHNDGSLLFILLTPPGDANHRTEAKSKTGGLGLSYIRARLEESWLDDFSFNDGPDKSGGWRSVIIMPEVRSTAAKLGAND